MKTQLKIIILIIAAHFSFQSNAQIDTAWTRTFGTSYWDEMHGITTDINDNAFIAGWTRYSSADYDWAVAKYNSSGTQEWLKSYSWVPGSDIDGAELIASDQSGNVIVVGSTASYLLKLIKYNSAGDTVWSALNTDYYGALVYTITLDFAGNIFLAGFYDSPRKGLLIKYNQNGIQQWAKEFSSPSSGYCQFGDAVTDDYGNIYVTGRCEYGADAFDVPLIKYNSQGDTVWVKHWNGPGTEPYDEAVKLKLDNLGNIFIGGHTSASLQSPMNFVTLKYDTVGNFYWAKFFDGLISGIDGIVDMAVDDLGNVIVTGWTSSGANNSDIETVKYNTNGDTVWTKRFGANYNEQPTAMTIDDNKNIYITGYGINAGGNGGWNGLTIKYDAAGTEKWVAEYDGNHNNAEDEFYDLTIDNNDDVIVTGRSHGDTTSYDFLIIKYQNSTSGISLIETGNPGLHISCYPNPISNSAFINYYLPENSNAVLKIVDVLGRKVFTSDFYNQSAGNHTFQFNASVLSAGIYFCKLESGNQSDQTKMILIK